MARITKDSIYQGALEAFAELGFAGTSMDYIAEKSGVVKRTLYYNFKTKEDLFYYVMNRATAKLTALLDQALSEQEFVPKWKRVVKEHLHFYEENQAFFLLIIQEMWKKDLDSPFSFPQLFKDYFQRLDQALRQDQEKGYLDPELDIPTCSASIFGMITIPAARSVLLGQPIVQEQKVKSITTLLLQSFGGE